MLSFGGVAASNFGVRISGNIHTFKWIFGKVKVIKNTNNNNSHPSWPDHYLPIYHAHSPYWKGFPFPHRGRQGPSASPKCRSFHCSRPPPSGNSPGRLHSWLPSSTKAPPALGDVGPVGRRGESYRSGRKRPRGSWVTANSGFLRVGISEEVQVRSLGAQEVSNLLVPNLLCFLDLGLSFFRL